MILVVFTGAALSDMGDQEGRKASAEWCHPFGVVGMCSIAGPCGYAQDVWLEGNRYIENEGNREFDPLCKFTHACQIKVRINAQANEVLRPQRRHVQRIMTAVFVQVKSHGHASALHESVVSCWFLVVGSPPPGTWSESCDPA
jgi:hypothetical protein